MQGVGIDIVKISRINLDEKLINRILHKREIDILNEHNSGPSKKQFLAGRWAIKEAIFKTGQFSHLNFNEINIQYNEKKQPMIDKCDKKIFLSISHEAEYAVGLAILS